MQDGYVPVLPHMDFDVCKIYSVHYFEYANNYTYPGEKHDFWEFCYVDKGEIYVVSDEKKITLKQPQIIFHKPNEWHSLEANKNIAPNLVVASFSCESPYMEWFNDKVLAVGDKERQLLATIIEEASNAFVTPLNDPETKHLARKATSAIGSEQIIKACFEQLLIGFYRKGHKENTLTEKPTSLIKEKNLSDSIDRVVDYLKNNIDKKLTLEEICKANLVGRSYLQKVFRDKTGGGVIEYFGRLKIEAAKQMIREGRGNFTEIAAELGYNSIHYFSRHFKKVTGMTPSEYASSVKVLTDRSSMD